EPARQFAVFRADGAAGDITQLVAELVDDAEAGDAQSRIESEDTCGGNLGGRSHVIDCAVFSARAPAIRRPPPPPCHPAPAARGARRTAARPSPPWSAA